MSINPEDEDRTPAQSETAKKIDVAYIDGGGRGSAKMGLIEGMTKHKIKEMEAKLAELNAKPGQRGIINPDFKPITAQSLLQKESAADIAAWKKDKYIPRSLPHFGWKNGDAWKLYKYQDQGSGLVEWIWNSRDGVVPFIIRGKDGGELRHVDFWEDVYLPNYVPPVGTRIFADRPDFEEAKHQFNVRVVEVDITLHNIFLNQASFTPWRPDMKPKGFA